MSIVATAVFLIGMFLGFVLGYNGCHEGPKQLPIDNSEKEKELIRQQAVEELIRRTENKTYKKILDNQYRMELCTGLSVANRYIEEAAAEMMREGLDGELKEVK